MIRDLGNSGAMPVLEQLLRFTGARQRLIASNIANLDTPDYRPLDVSPRSFQAALREAVETRRRNGPDAPLQLPRTGEVEQLPDGHLVVRPGTPSPNVLYHDRNNRDFETMVQQLAENGMAFRLATDLLRRENDVLRTAISQRVS